MLEKQLIELNEDLQSLESDKNELNNQIDELKEQLQSRDRQIQMIEVRRTNINKDTSFFLYIITIKYKIFEFKLFF